MGKEPNGFTADELAELNAGGDDDLGADTQEGDAEIDADLGEQGEVDIPAAQPQRQPQNDGKPPKGFVPHQALHEAREQAKAAAARADRMEQMFQRLMERQPQQQQGAKEDQLPDFNTDPVGHLAAKLERAERKLADFDQRGQQQQQMTEQQGRTQALMDKYAGSVRTFKRDAPDYDAAYQHLADVRDRELEALGFDDPTERANRLQYEEGLIVGNALRSGKDPARMLYEFAKSRGYKGAAAQQEEDKLARLQKGANAAKTLNGGKAPQNDEMTLERLADLQDSDPEAADRLWERMRKAGRLG